MKHLLLTKLALASLLLSGCLMTRPRPPELPLPAQRIVMRTYSIQPFEEEGWMVLGHDADSVGLLKEGAAADETMTIVSGLVRLPEFSSEEDFLRTVDEHESQDSGSRFKILLHEVKPYAKEGMVCATSHILAEDHKANRRSERLGAMVLEIFQLTCGHPGQTVGITVGYSHRFYPEDRDPDFMLRAMGLIDNVKIHD